LPFLSSLRQAVGRARLSTLVIIVSAILLVIALPILSVARANPIVASIVLSPLALTLVVATLRRLGFGVWTIIIIAGALVLYGAYFSYTSFGERNHDGPSHFKYVEYLAKHGSLPPPSHCFVCHHPPAYYGLAAAVYRLCALTKLVRPESGIQLFSMVLMTVFIIYAVLIIRRFTQRESVITLATALVVFWPYTFINSVRLHNDILVTTLMAAGLYYLVKWDQDDRPTDLWVAAAVTAFSVLAKSNGYILVTTLVALIGYRLVFRPNRLVLLKRCAPPLLTLGVTIIAFIVTRTLTTHAEIGENVLGAAYKIHPRDYVGNEPHNYLYFDLKSFVEEPYLLSRTDGSGRQYFWNHLLKSSLFATHNEVPDLETAYRLNRRIAEIMNVMVLAMLAYLLAGIALVTKQRFRRYLVLVLNTALFLLFIMAFKALIPSAHHNDFRFVYPIVIALSLGYALVTASHTDKHRVLGYLGVVLAGSFMLLSIVYYLPKYDLVVNYLPRKVLRKKENALSTVVPARTKWDKRSNIIMAGDELVEMALAPHRTVKTIDLSVDHNDQYELTIFGQQETRKIVVGPFIKEGHEGLARYTQAVEPPVKKVRAIRLWPFGGDRRYSLGHLIVK